MKLPVIEDCCRCMLLISSPQMKYKVFFHRGDELSLKTKLLKGKAWLDDAGLHIDGHDGFTVPTDDLLEAELFRVQGLGRTIRIEYKSGRLFLSVVRLMIGQFTLINFSETGFLQKRLAALTKKPH